MIEWRRTTDLRNEIGAEVFNQVIDMFFAEAEQTLEELKGAEGEQLAAMFHLLKGSALNLGFQAFADACSDGEISARQGRVDTNDRISVRQIYEQSRDAYLKEKRV